MLLNNNKFSLFYSILKNIKEENINIFITIHQYDNTVRLMFQFFIFKLNVI
jgi:beta-glucosidase/6-phospho-beta-glucosidase/beta-galactosidase